MLENNVLIKRLMYGRDGDVYVIVRRESNVKGLENCACGITIPVI